MSAAHWLALLCLLVQCLVMVFVARLISAKQETAEAVRELTLELKHHRDDQSPDSELVA